MAFAVDVLPAINDRDSHRVTRAALRRVLASPAAAGTSPALTPPPRAFMVSSSPVATIFSVAVQRRRTWLSPNNKEPSIKPRQRLSQTCWTGIAPPQHPVTSSSDPSLTARSQAQSDCAVAVHPVRGSEQRTSDRSCVRRCQVFVMVGRQPHADVAILVLHGSHISRETFIASQGRPVRPEMRGRLGFPIGMLGVAPTRAGCGGHALSLRHPEVEGESGGRYLRYEDDPSLG